MVDEPLASISSVTYRDGEGVAMIADGVGDPGEGALLAAD